ncbi:MAG TPA: DUF1540 domain-containing protein [Candidatus Bathyarchaeia archaeon]|nr:DUF1540 domain-containing protein [Candidatus Bathyarchaeia archaeon]
MEMSQVIKCDMSVCVYNQENRCITPGITVGSHAECNTFNHGSAKGGFDDANGGVGACLAADCKFNERLECKARKVSVMVHDRHPDCATFQQRK